MLLQSWIRTRSAAFTIRTTHPWRNFRGMSFLWVLLLSAAPCHLRLASAMTTTPAGNIPPSIGLVSEGSLYDVRVASTLGSQPGSEPGFYNPKRRVGRDFVVLSVAYWLAMEANASAAKGPDAQSRPVRLLDATCATGMQGLRTAVESPILARAYNQQTQQQDDDEKDEIPALKLQVVLNDMDEHAADLAVQNAHAVMNGTARRTTATTNSTELDDVNVTVTRRVAQAFMYEETFEVSVLDPFGSVQPFLDAALARAPHRGLVEVCATDVGVLHGTRPSIATRHYNTAQLQSKRPPCFRERGVRLLLASMAQAAGRHDRGIRPVMGVSTEHFCVASVQILRGARAADATAHQIQRVRICRTCGASGPPFVERDTTGSSSDDAPPPCDCEPIDGAGTDAREEGPLWVGPLYDVDAIQAMFTIANLDEAKEEGFISNETRTLLAKIKDEAVLFASDKTDNPMNQTSGLFQTRRPGVAAGGRTPKLATVMKELQRQGFQAARTHFCIKSLNTNASPREFDNAVKAVLARDGYNKDPTESI